MVGLLDIAPLTQTVTVRDHPIEVTGVSAKGVAQLLLRFPELRALISGRDVGLDQLLALGRRHYCRGHCGRLRSGG